MMAASPSPPRVSILIPTYNRADLVGAAIDAALAQTVREIEVVVVDNASTDATWEVCAERAARDERVRIERNAENVGPVRNWGRCLELARAPLAKILFSDDLIDPRYLELTLPWLDDPGVAFVFTTTIVGADPSVAVPYYRWLERSGTASSRRFLSDAVPDRGRVPVSPGAGLFRTADLRASLRTSIPGPMPLDVAAHGAGPDVLLYLLTAAAYPKVAFVVEPVTFFRAHPESITLSDREGRVADGYRLAYAWFATTRLPTPRREWALARLWLNVVRERGRWASPDRVLARYVDLRRTPLVLAFGTVLAVGSRIKSLLRRRR